MRPAILFDMNGVLIDDEDLHRQAFQHVAGQIGMTLSDDDYLSHFAGRTDRAGFQAFLAERSTHRIDLIDDLLVRKSRAYRDLAAKGLRSYPGAAELVEDLRRTGHDLAIVTSSIRPEVTVVLDFLGLANAFDVVITAEDVSEGKPSPVPYLAGATGLTRPPHECVVIEDAPSGITSAKAADMACVAVASTHEPADLADADVIVGRISELTPATLNGLLS